MKCLDLMASTQPGTQKTNFDICTRKLPNISCKTFRKKSISLNFVNLHTILWQRLWVCKMPLHESLVFSTNLVVVIFLPWWVFFLGISVGWNTEVLLTVSSLLEHQLYTKNNVLRNLNFELAFHDFDMSLQMWHFF